MKAGTNINRYIIENIISDNGGTARIYLAHLKDDEKLRVAIKFSKTNMIGKGHEDVLLEKEAELLQRPDWRHPGIVRVYPSPLDGGRPQYSMRAVDFPGTPYYMVMEYLKGKSLGENLKIIQTYPFGWKLELFYQLLTTISFIHSKGFAHRDIKPDNIIFREPISRTATPQVVLIDFALASNGEADFNFVENSYTLEYTSPERIAKSMGLLSDRYDVQAEDVWSLGMVFYEILTGNFLLKGTREKVRTTIIRERIDPTLPNEPEYHVLASFIREMLNPDSKKRPTVDLVIKALESKFPPPRVPIS